MIRGSYLWLDTMIDSTIKSLIVWLIEWSESPFTKNYLAVPRVLTHLLERDWNPDPTGGTQIPAAKDNVYGNVLVLHPVVG